MSITSRSRVVVTLFLLIAFACTDGSTPESRGAPPATARPSPSPSVGEGLGNFEVETVRVSSRADLVAEVNNLGFDEVLVLGMGRPLRIQHYTTDHMHVRSVYRTKSGRVRVFQSNDQGITSGPGVTIRGIEGVMNGEGASWVEGDYLLDINPLERRYVRALRWVRRS